MQEDDLKARVRKRFKTTTMSDHDQPVAANLLARQFEAEAPNQRWVGDTTEFVIGSSGNLYLAAERVAALMSSHPGPHAPAALAGGTAFTSTAPRKPSSMGAPSRSSMSRR